MRRTLLVVFAVLLAIIAVAGWFVQDANRFKPALSAYIEAETGVPVRIGGNLEWKLAPRLWLVAENVHADHEGRAWSLERLELRPDSASMLRNPANLSKWRLNDLAVENLAVVDGRGVLRAQRLAVGDVAVGSEASIAGVINYQGAGWPPIEASLAGSVAVAEDRLRVRDLALRMPNASATCNLEAMPNGRLWPPVAPEQKQLLPVAVMRAYDWDGRCDLHRVLLGAETVENAYVVLDNKEGGSIVSFRAPDFLGGEGQLEALINTGRLPVSWQISPAMAGVDSTRLAAWLGGDSLVDARVDYGGTIHMTGNTAAALAASIEAETRIATGPGKLDSTRFAAPLAQAGALLQATTGAVPALPNVLDYDSLAGEWTVNGYRHRLDVALDSLRLEARGDYRPDEDDLDMRGVITLGDSGERWGLRFAPALAGVALHFVCRGALGATDCSLDSQRTLVGAFAVEGSARAEDLIEQHIPDQYQDAARALLERLGVGVDAALRKAPDELIDAHVPEKYRGMAHSLLDRLDTAPDEQN